MASIFLDNFTGAAALASSRPPDVGANWVNRYSDARFVLSGAGRLNLGVSGGFPMGDMSNDIVFQPGATKLNLTAVFKCVSGNNARFIMSIQRMTAAGTVASNGVAEIDMTALATSYAPNLNTLALGTGANSNVNTTIGSSAAYVNTEHVWELELPVAGGVKLKMDGGIVLSQPTVVLSSAVGVFTDYGVRMRLSITTDASASVDKIEMIAAGVAGPVTPAVYFWTEFVNTQEWS